MVFDDFKDSQNVNYLLLKNSILNDKLSHAYLFDVNNNENAFGFVLSFIKMIICPHHYSNNSNSLCKNCNCCMRVDDGNYSEIKIIESESSVIKKEQLLDLQNEFSTSAIEGNNRIYIIKDCDKMNKYAANSLLKFLEEPLPGIIAILMTNNINKVISTIISRCQLIRLNNTLVFNNNSLENFAFICCDNKDDVINFISDKSNGELVLNVINFISYFEENGLDILLHMKKMWYNNVQSRDECILAFKILVYFYFDILKYKINNHDLLFIEQMNVIKKISSNNSIKQIIDKVNIFQYGYEMVLSNLNVNLLLDDIIIRLGDVS